MDLDGIAAIVTGGASGLGAAAAGALAARGARVAIWDRDTELGEAMAAEIGGIFCRVDVTQDADIASAVTASRAAHGTARLLVAAAGIAVGARIADRKKGAHSLDLFRKVIDVNLIGSFNCARHFAADLLEADAVALGERGAIVFISSLAASEGQVGQVAYSASKAALVGMTLPIARDLADDGIRCVSVLPGFFRTPLAEAMPPHRIERIVQMAEFPRALGDPHWFGSLVCEIATNPMLNGDAIRLDGAARLTR